MDVKDCYPGGAYEEMHRLQRGEISGSDIPSVGVRTVCEEEDDHFHAVTSAVIELSNGKVLEVSPSNITFLDKPE